MRTPTFDDIVELHARIIQQSGGSSGMRDRAGIEAALAQPLATSGTDELHSTPVAKAAALGFSLISGRSFTDGNNRLGHAATELFLIFNNYEIEAAVDEQESVLLRVAGGAMSREEFAAWLGQHVVQARKGLV
jgi:death-on-curing protein